MNLFLRNQLRQGNSHRFRFVKALALRGFNFYQHFMSKSAFRKATFVPEMNPAFDPKQLWLRAFASLMFISTAHGSLLAQFKNSDFTRPAEAFEIINDGSANFNPIVADNGNTIWFTRSNHNANEGGPTDQDIWQIEFKDGAWRKAGNNFKGLNSAKSDLIIGQSESNTIYILRYGKLLGEDINNIEAYKRVGNTYTYDHTIALPPLEITSSYFGFFVSRDESFIIISMKGQFSFGKEDLYICLKNEGVWTAPKHMGARINTSGFEMSPFVAADGKHLFFASEGHHTMGKSDIFVSTRLDDTWQNWSKPENLGPNINTPGFEAYFTLNEAKKEAYFYSDYNIPEGAIYKATYKPGLNGESFSAHTAASGFIRFKELPQMSVKLNLMDENDQVIQSVTTNDEGYFNLQSFLPDRDYKLAIDDSLREQIGDADIFLTNDLGERMVYMNDDRLGMFGFKVLSQNRSNKFDTFKSMTEKGKVVDRQTTISGRVAAYGTLNDKLKLNIVDENNNVLKSIETDEDGYFSFSTDARERRYFLSIDKSLTGLVDVYEVFLTNENEGENIVVSKTDKHLFEFVSLSDGSKGSMTLLDEKDYGMPAHVFENYGMIETSANSDISGYLLLGTLPVIDAEIALLDENDQLLTTARTDTEGRFSLDASLHEGNYVLKLTDEQQEKLAGSEIYLAKNPGDVLVYLNDSRSGVFAFKKLVRNKPLTLYSLRTQAEDGQIISDQNTTLKGKFQYRKLPSTGVTLNLLDEDENVVQTTRVDEEGNFEFNKYTTDKTYFIAAESEGLSDIYEIYLSGQQKNVLVNRTNKYVFSFKVLPTQDVMLTKAYASEPEMNGHGISLQLPADAGRSYYEFDLAQLKKANYTPLTRVCEEAKAGQRVMLRLYVQRTDDNAKAKLKTLNATDFSPAIEYLEGAGIASDRIEIRNVTSDQALLLIHR